MFNIDIPENIWERLNKNGKTNYDIEEASYERYGKYIVILNIAYNEENSYEWYETTNFGSKRTEEWIEIRDKITNNSQQITFPKSKISLKEEYLFSGERTEKLLVNTYKCRLHVRRIKEEFHQLALTLKTVKQLFSGDKYGSTKSFMEWYEKELGLSKDVVSLLMKRLTLVETELEFKKEIGGISEQGIKELTKKSLDPKLRRETLRRVREGEIVTGNDIKEFIEVNSPEKMVPSTDDITFEQINSVIGKYFDYREDLEPEENYKVIKHLESIIKIINKRKTRLRKKPFKG